jgi:superfamily II RNA helicase
MGIKKPFRTPFRTPVQSPQHAKTPAPMIGHMSRNPSPDVESTYVHTQQKIVEQQNKPSVPLINGIPLVAVNCLPDRFRGVFSFPVFNAMQSRCFETIYNSSENLVVSAPTSSGKTVILELAICAIFRVLERGTYKIVYQAPTKALCSERKRG